MVGNPDRLVAVPTACSWDHNPKAKPTVSIKAYYLSRTLSRFIYYWFRIRVSAETFLNGLSDPNEWDGTSWLSDLAFADRCERGTREGNWKGL